MSSEKERQFTKEDEIIAEARINAFHNFHHNHKISNAAFCLWCTLLILFLRSGWPKQINLTLTDLAKEVQLSEYMAKNARRELVELGLIEYQNQGKGVPDAYKLNEIVA